MKKEKKMCRMNEYSIAQLLYADNNTHALL